MPNFFRSLKQLLSGGPRRRSKRNKQQVPTEALEQRQLLTADVSLQDGVLTITGTASDDAVQITAEGEHVVVVQVGSFEPFPAAQVKRIEFMGHAGNDEFHNQSPLPSSLNGGIGNDLLIGGPQADVINGGPGDDRLYGNGGDDVLRGQGGVDSFVGGPGNDTMDGGENSNWYLAEPHETNVANGALDVRVNLKEANANVWSDAELALVDQAMRELFTLTGSTNVFKDPHSGRPLVFVRTDSIEVSGTVNNNSVLAINRAGRPETHFVDVSAFGNQEVLHRTAESTTITFADATFVHTSDEEVMRTVQHELAHNWDSPKELIALIGPQGKELIEEFWQAGGWLPSAPKGDLAADYRNDWSSESNWHFNTKSDWSDRTVVDLNGDGKDAELYSQYKPEEDFAVSFEDYLDAGAKHRAAVAPTGMEARFKVFDKVLQALADADIDVPKRQVFECDWWRDEVISRLPDPLTRRVLDALVPQGLHDFLKSLDPIELSRLIPQLNANEIRELPSLLSNSDMKSLLSRLDASDLNGVLTKLSPETAADVLSKFDRNTLGNLGKKLGSSVAAGVMKHLSGWKMRDLVKNLSPQQLTHVTTKLDASSIRRFADNLPLKQQIHLTGNLSSGLARQFVRGLKDSQVVDVLERVGTGVRVRAIRGWVARDTADYVFRNMSSSRLKAAAKHFTVGNAVSFAKSKHLSSRGIGRLLRSTHRHIAGRTLVKLRNHSRFRTVVHSLGSSRLASVLRYTGPKTMNAVFRKLNAAQAGKIVNKLATSVKKKVFQHVNASSLKNSKKYWNKATKSVQKSLAKAGKSLLSFGRRSRRWRW